MVKRLIWSIDAFEDSSIQQEPILEVLKCLTRDRKVEVEPVYVLSPEQLELPLEFTPPWIKHYRPAALKSLTQKLKDVKLAGLISPTVLVNSKASTKGATRTLAAYAKSQGAELIAVSTHGRKGLSRLLMGSFAETLLLQSKLPVLTVGPKTKSVSNMKTILFPTDLSGESFHSFKRVLELARELKSQVILFHSIVNLTEPVFQSGIYLLGGGWIPAPLFLEKRETFQREVATRWMNKTKHYNVPVEFYLDKSSDSVVDSVLKFSVDKSIPLIAMVAQSGPIASAILGSVTRQVVKTSLCPVWVVRNPVPKK